MHSDQFKALADENRLAIVHLLADGEHCLCDISSALDISNALASHHVKRLDDAGLVDTRRQGLWLRVSLRTDVFAELGEALTQMGTARREAVPCCSVRARKVSTDG